MLQGIPDEQMWWLEILRDITDFLSQEIVEVTAKG